MPLCRRAPAEASLVLALVAATLGLSACATAAPAPAHAPPIATAAAAARVDPPAATLQRLENGDRACYVVLLTAAGERSLEGDFELCAGGKHDATRLIGKRVRYTTRRARVLAASCQGNADCGKSDEVDLVTTLTAE